MGNDIWVAVEHDGNDIQSVTYEMLDEGRRIASRLNSELVAVVLGHQLPDFTSILASYSADVVYLVEHELLAQYATDAYAYVLATLLRERNPFLLLQAATANGRDLAPRLAARLGVGLASDCVMVKLNLDGVVEAIRPTHSDKVYTTVVLTSSPPFIATFRPGAIGISKPDSIRQARVERVEMHIPSTPSRVRPIKTVKADPSTLDIAEGEIVVSGGRGMGSTENWRLVEELAEALGGCVAGSRMAMDAGWIPRERLVGQTGKSISPRLYFTLGISGAREHLAGIREARSVVAINKDPQAPIFRAADKKVIGDLNEVVPVLIQKLRQLRQAEADNSRRATAKEGVS